MVEGTVEMAGSAIGTTSVAGVEVGVGAKVEVGTNVGEIVKSAMFCIGVAVKK